MTAKQKQLLLCCFDLMDLEDVDGIWGQQSEAATRQLQHGLGITEDGVFGDGTRDAVFERLTSGEPLADDITDTNVGNKSDEDINVPAKTGTFWDEIPDFDRDTEFGCTCNGRGCNGFPVEPVEQLVRNLQEIRTHFGKPVRISSGVRCQLRNSELPGSAGNSLHMRGKAADFAVLGVHSSVVLAYVKTLPNVDEAYAIDESFVHMGVLKYA